MSEVYLGRDGKKGLALGKLLGEGASGKVYALPGMAGFAAKLYHDDAECRKHEAKIELMLGNPPDLPALVHENQAYPQIAWPEAKLYDRVGRFIGFLMPEIDFARSTSLVNLLQKNSRRAEKISEYYGYRVLVARNLASVFVELHRAGHHMIDMKPANLRFYPTVSWMAVVDVDGFSIAGGAKKRVAAEQVSDEYIAPESWKKQPAELGLQQDLFALAVIIFQLLDNGVHPFAGSAARGSTQATDLQARIQEGLYPYGITSNPALTPSTASIHKSFRRSTRLLFDRAFMAGRKRPTALEWREHLDELVDTLVPCAAKPKEHAHFGGGCGFCGHEARVEAAARVAKPRPRPRPQQPKRYVTQPGSNVVRLPLPPTRPAPNQPMMPLRRPATGFQVPRPAFKWWQNWPLLLLLALLLVSSDVLWRQVSPATGAGLRAAGMLTMISPPSQAATPTPEDIATVENSIVGAAPDLVGNCTGGQVDSEIDGCSDPQDTPMHRAMAARYRKLLANAGGYDRAYLIEEHSYWLDQRASCKLQENSAPCLADIDNVRYDRLRNWKAISAELARTSTERETPPITSGGPGAGH